MCPVCSERRGYRPQRSLYWLCQMDYIKDLENFFLQKACRFSFLDLLSSGDFDLHPTWFILHPVSNFETAPSTTLNSECCLSSFPGSFLQSPCLLLSTPITVGINYEDGSEVSVYPSLQLPNGYFQLVVLTATRSPHAQSQTHFYPQNRLACCFLSFLKGTTIPLSINHALRTQEERKLI